MARPVFRPIPGLLPMLLVTLGVAVSGGGTAFTGVVAQASSFECRGADVPSASPAVATPIVAEPVPRGGFPARGGDLTVFAAVSLTDAFEEIADDLEAANERLSITYNFAGSQVLVTQLQEGAEADVFASANAVQMAAAAEGGLIAGDPITFVRNRLAIVVPADNPAGIETAADLADDGLRLVLAQADVPVGRYAREAVCAMDEDVAAYGGGFVERVAANVVSEEEDVRDVLSRVRLGEADAGVVYVSDAAATVGDVAIVEIPEAVNAAATYPIAAVEGGDAGLAEAFIAYVLGPEGQATLAAAGFEPVGA